MNEDTFPKVMETDINRDDLFCRLEECLDSTSKVLFNNTWLIYCNKKKIHKSTKLLALRLLFRLIECRNEGFYIHSVENLDYNNVRGLLTSFTPILLSQGYLIYRGTQGFINLLSSFEI